MSAPFTNLYHLRKVAESAAKPCMVCYKPTTSVLVTPDKKDFFYVCPSHTKDRGFASAVVDPEPTPEELDRKRKEAEERMLAEEIERVKKEYEENQRKKKEKDEGEKEKEKEKDEEKDKKENEEKEKGKGKKETSPPVEPKKAEEPRIFTLHKTIFDSRMRRWKQQQISKLNQERLRSSAFPSVPKGDPV
ncbi:uncharacterized protein H6S33_009490 [Morchella sextelata]|uniref:uncharacterized protein n=1 Tax=Morchella sextelata TaxID=1174677 RepID=UPI001D046921|nr:uncharacterized protein H6S33_009490 [Morchella sextelata]KAH0613110.1 hypothetical protein H6S33_009490 [Morchella sextelata]